MFLAIFIAGSYYNDILQNLDLRIMIKNLKNPLKNNFPLEIRNSVFHHDRYSSTPSKLGFQILMDQEETEKHSRLSCGRSDLGFQDPNSKIFILKWMRCITEITEEETAILGLFLSYRSVTTIKPEFVSFRFFFQAPEFSMHSCTAPCFPQKL